MVAALEIEGLTAHVGEKQILKGLDLEVPFGEIHAIMGPNGSGKSTLCHVLTGKSGYGAKGSARLDGDELLGLPVDERARKGVMLGFQYPVEIPGLSLETLLAEAVEERGIDQSSGEELIASQAEKFDMARFMQRSVNGGLSGGEKKRSEIFQMAVLQPRLALLDEIDSGLDIDAVRQVAEAVEAMRGPDIAVLIITHYSRVLQYLSPDKVHVMIDGRIVMSGGPELADRLEDVGYDGIRKELGIETVTETRQKRPGDFFTETPFD